MQQRSVSQYYVDINDDLFNLLCGSTQSVIIPPIYVGGHLLECVDTHAEVFGPAYSFEVPM